MNLTTEKYPIYLSGIPDKGRCILAYQEDEKMVVYQAFRPQIAEYALEHQKFGGPHYSFNRMSWIKPNFLWMMYRSGWAEKEGQEYVLGIWIKKAAFETILEQAVFANYQSYLYESELEWKKDLQNSHVRLQWDPDHDPYGNKEERRAIQLGLRGPALEKFVNQDILQIDDMTPFVRDQKQKVDKNQLDDLLIPAEKVYDPSVLAKQKVGLVGVNQNE